jgi:hypothetical protein
MNNIRWDGERFIRDSALSLKENDDAIWKLYNNMSIILGDEIMKLQRQQRVLDNAYELWLKENKEKENE